MYIPRKLFNNKAENGLFTSDIYTSYIPRSSLYLNFWFYDYLFAEQKNIAFQLFNDIHKIECKLYNPTWKNQVMLNGWSSLIIGEKTPRLKVIASDSFTYNKFIRYCESTYSNMENFVLNYPGIKNKSLIDIRKVDEACAVFFEKLKHTYINNDSARQHIKLN